MSKIVNFLKDESGASAAEYAIILGIVATVIITAIGGLATAIAGKMTSTATTITG